MLPQRTPLALRDRYRLYNYKLYPYKHRLILRACKFGGIIDEIADIYSIPVTDEACQGQVTCPVDLEVSCGTAKLSPGCALILITRAFRGSFNIVPTSPRKEYNRDYIIYKY